MSGVRNSWLTLEKNVGLGLIEFGQGLGTLLLGLVAARAADPGGDMTGHHFDKAAIAVVEPAMPVQPGHQEPERRAGLLQNRRTTSA